MAEKDNKQEAAAAATESSRPLSFLPRGKSFAKTKGGSGSIMQKLNGLCDME